MIENFFTSILGHIAIWSVGVFAVVGFIRKVTKDYEDDLDPKIHIQLVNTLILARKIDDKDISSWIPDFNKIFDHFFGEKHLRWRCFYRSALISFFTFMVLCCMVYTDIIGDEIIVEFMSMAIICNVVIDFISLLETRLIMATALPTILKIIVDAVLTTLMAVLWISIVMGIFTEGGIGFYLNDTIKTLMGEEAYPLGDLLVVIYRIVIVTTFTTSIWLWLHGLSHLTIRLLSNGVWFMNFLNVEEKPVRALGTIINAYVIVLSIPLFIIFQLIPGA